MKKEIKKLQIMHTLQGIHPTEIKSWQEEAERIYPLLEQTYNQARQEMIDQVQRYLHDWLIDFPNRPLDKRKDTYEEVNDIKRDIIKKLKQ
jgi:hypothetical protein